MTALDNEFLYEPEFHSVTEEILLEKIENFTISPSAPVPKEIYPYVSPLRHLLLEWFPFKTDSKILEIGGNVGELTEILCEQGSEVVSIEPNDIKRKIISLRSSGKQNLQVKKISFKDIGELGRFDVIIIHNCFGYLKKYFTSPDTYVDFLSTLYNMLEADGKILIAVNNRIGIKYLAGAVEEHTKKMFAGIKDYDGYNKVRTFTQTELIRIFKRAGIAAYKFYYPFPDYSFPTEIHTSESLRYFNYGDDDFFMDYEMPELFDRKKLARTLRREGSIELFANSFLIELSNGATTDVIYYKPNLGQKYHSEGCLIYGSDMAHATLCEINILEKKYDNRLVYNSKEIYCRDQKVKFCFGNTFDMPFCDRLKEKLENLIDSCITEDNTDDLCNIVADFWIRIANAIREFNSIDIHHLKDFAGGKPLCDFRKIFIKGDGTICILWPESSLKYLKNDTEYVIWALIYDWYLSEILPYKSYVNYIPIHFIYDKCNIVDSSITKFKLKKSSEEDQASDEKELLSYSYEKYELGLLEPTQLLVQGTPIITDADKIQSLDTRQKTLLYEDQLLAAFRR